MSDDPDQRVASLTATALRILDAVGLDDDDDTSATNERLSHVIQAPLPVLDDEEPAVDATSIVVPAYLLASTAVSYAADRLGISRAEVIYDLREIMQPLRL